MANKPHTCAVCGKEKYRGAVCVVKGYRGMRWICFDCQDAITKQDERVSEDGSSKDE